MHAFAPACRCPHFASGGRRPSPNRPTIAETSSFHDFNGPCNTESCSADCSCGYERFSCQQDVQRLFGTAATAGTATTATATTAAAATTVAATTVTTTTATGGAGVLRVDTSDHCGSPPIESRSAPSLQHAAQRQRSQTALSVLEPLVCDPRVTSVGNNRRFRGQERCCTLYCEARTPTPCARTTPSVRRA